MVSPLLLVALAAPVGAQQPSTGRPACPCVTTELAEGLHPEVSVCVDGACFPSSHDHDHDHDSLSFCTHGANAFDGRCFDGPRTYGSSVCAAHDQGLGECKEAAPPHEDTPAWCGESWCYVDAAACAASDVSFVAMGSRLSIAYSYDTCGGDERAWTAGTAAMALSGRTLKLAVGRLEVPYLYGVDDAGDIVEGRDGLGGLNGTAAHGRIKGIHADLLDLVAMKAGFAFEYVDISGASLAMFGSESVYTACVHDLAVGVADVCADFLWSTVERLEMAPLATPLKTDLFYLFAPRAKIDKDASDISRLMRNSFRPFSFRLWLAVLGVIVLHSVANAYFAAAHGGDADDDRGSVISHLPMETYRALVAIFGASVQEETPSDRDHGDVSAIFAARLVNLGYAFFILLAVASYTANLAAMLASQKDRELEIESITHCAHKRCRLCVNSVPWPQIDALYGNLDVVFVHVGPSGFAAIDGLVNDECDAAIIATSQYETLDEHSKYQSKIADYQFIGEPLFSVPSGIFVSTAYQQALNYYIRQEIEDGSYERFYNDHVAEFQVSPYVTTEISEDDVEALSVTHFSAPLIVFGATLVVATGLAAWKRVAKHMHKDPVTGRQMPTFHSRLFAQMGGKN